MLRKVPLFGVNNEGKSRNVSAQERVNLYVHVPEDPEANGLVYYPTPGLTTEVNFGANPSRGLYTKGDVRYAVNGATLWEIAANGTTTSRGTLLTTGGRVDITDNGTQMLIVDGTYGYIFTFATNTLAQIADADLPAPESCCFLNGYFIVQKTDSGQFYISGLYDGTTWDALDFATAESDPDDIVRAWVQSGTLYLFGTKTTEPWGDSGAADFPLARIGSAAIEWGLAAKWSLASYMGGVAFLRKNKLGALEVCVLVGTSAQPLPDSGFEYQLSQYGDVSNATGFSYMVDGRQFYQLNFPSEDASWLYDGKAWNKVSSGGGRHRAEIQVNFLNRCYVSDYENGKLYELSPSVYTDDGEYIVREFISRHNKTGNFSRVSALWIDMETGVGLQSGQGSDPQVMLQVSRDGGHTYGNELWRSFGEVGKYTARAKWNRLGRARDWVFKFRVTDPVKTVFVSGWAQYEQ